MEDVRIYSQCDISDSISVWEWDPVYELYGTVGKTYRCRSAFSALCIFMRKLCGCKNNRSAIN